MQILNSHRAMETLFRQWQIIHLPYQSLQVQPQVLDYRDLITNGVYRYQRVNQIELQDHWSVPQGVYLK
jgi:hypothetical protein